jgi:TolA-binding protein
MRSQRHNVTTSQVTKSQVTIVTALLFSLMLAGCGNDQYAIERQYYWAQKQAEKVFRNPHATPPKQLQRVLKTFSNFSAKYPKSALAVDAEFTIARLHMVKEEYEKARVQLKKVLNTYSKNALVCSEALFLLGNSYEIQNKWDSALAQYKKITQDYPTTLRGVDIPVYIIQHYKLKLQPDIMREATREAISHYNSLIAKYPGSPLAYRLQILVAQCYTILKDWQSALDTFELIIKNYKDKVNMEAVLMDMAGIYSRELKDRPKARETLKRMLSDYPKSRMGNVAKNMLKQLGE